MSSSLDDKDKQELERRRLTDSVSEAVEARLTKRYTVMGLVFGVLISGGVSTFMDTLTQDARDEITRTRVILEQSKEALTDIRDQNDKIQGLSSDIQERSQNLNKEIDALFASKEALFRSIDANNQRLTQLQALQSDLAKLESEMHQLQVALLESGGDPTKFLISPAGGETKQATSTIPSAAPASPADKLWSDNTIYIHYAKAQNQAEVDTLSKEIKGLGFAVPQPERVAQSTTAVRYYHEEDADAARYLAEVLTDKIQDGEFTTDAARLTPKAFFHLNKNVRPGTIELWLPL